MPKCDFNKVALQLYWNHPSAWVFSCKFAPYFQNNFSWEHLWMAAVAVSKQDCCYGLLRTYLDHQIMSNKWIPKEKPLNCLPEIKKTLRAIFYLNLAYEYLFYNYQNTSLFNHWVEQNKLTQTLPMHCFSYP